MIWKRQIIALDLSIADEDLLITDSDLTNVVADLALQGTSLPFSRLLPMFLKVPSYVLAGIFHNKSSGPDARNNKRDTQTMSRKLLLRCTR